MQPVRHRGAAEAWGRERQLVGYQANMPLSPVGRERFRSGAMNTPIVDIHTHNLEALPPAVISVSPGVELDSRRLYSVGIHPWDTATFDGDYTELERMALLPNVVAIGETGLDALRGAPLDRQEEIFRRHIEIAQRVGKPLILHVVKAWGRLLEISKAYRPPRQTAGHGGLLKLPSRHGPASFLTAGDGGLLMLPGRHGPASFLTAGHGGLLKLPSRHGPASFLTAGDGGLLKLPGRHGPASFLTAGHGGLLILSGRHGPASFLTAGHGGTLAEGRWIVHGFRGKAELARQLLAAGMDISLGERFNSEAARVIPAERLHYETDCSSLPIEEIAARIMAAREA